MKRSRRVPLVLIGTLVGLSGCGQDEEQVPVGRQAYQSLDDCTRDWGDSRYCSPDGAGQQVASGAQASSVAAAGTTASGGTSHGSSGVYLGPRYYWDRDIGKPVAIDNEGNWRPVNNTRITGTNGSSSARAFGAGVHASRGGFGSSAHGFSGGG